MDWKELAISEWSYLKLFAPIVVEMVSVMLSSFLTTFFSGQIGEDYIVTGVGIATVLNVGLLYGFILGYGTVFDSLVGALKAMYGDGAVSELVVKCSLQGLLIYLVCLGPYLGSGYLVRLFGEDVHVHEVTMLYLRLESPRPILLYLRDLLVKYLVVQGFPMTSILVSLSAPLFHSLFGWLLVVRYRWGLYGLAAAQIVNSALVVIVLVLICVWKRNQIGWSCNYRSISVGWWDMVKLGSFSGLRVTATYGLLVSSHILSQSSGAHTAEAVVIIDKISLPFYSSIFGGGYAVAMLVGDALGNGDQHRYSYSVKLGLLNWILERLIATIVYGSTILPLARLCAENQDVLDEINGTTPAIVVLLTTAALDELFARGILTPLGKQAFVGFTSMTAIYLIGIPLMTSLIFLYRVHASVIFWCFVGSNLVQCCGYVLRLFFIDTKQEIAKCRERSAEQQKAAAHVPPTETSELVPHVDYKYQSG